ncbi:DUF4012 domain-containing protein [Leifsonia sp. AG29]|uniref:DUF4012 domain-containing protein n=1 Tax=Leifsonia sp. AG29 TaxID=2598860 RepID=UPI00131CB2E7|nr:DUF4012 domain-containing protein [Leifsonia sp. AG29]
MAIGLARDPAPPRPAEPPAEPRSSSRRRTIVTVVVVVLVLLVAGLVGWIGLRGYLARQQLSLATPAANAVVDAVRSGDLTKATTAAAELRRSAASAADLTSDPVWRSAEAVPWAGPNLAAVRRTAAAVDTLASEVVGPLVGVAKHADPRSIAVKNGRVDLAPIRAAAPVVESAQTAFHRAQADVSSIDTSVTIGQIRSAVDRLRSLLSQTAPSMDALGNAARLLPPMLGADGPRNYLIVAQNPAELRATGGLIGSVSMLHADDGAISLPSHTVGATLGPWDEPVASLPDSTVGLYGPLVGRLLQDANATPDFPLAASTVSTMWTKTYGDRVDGVVALDPVALSQVLRATGPVTLSTGERLGADDAVRVLLSDVYARFAEPWRQDLFFSSSAEAIFHAVVGGGVDGRALVDSLAAAGASRRVLIWSAHPGEQSVLASTTLSGVLPSSTPTTAGIGVYFDDATGGKMDYYLRTQVSAGAAVCRADRTPTSVVEVTLANRAPADAAAALPAYVTGGGWFGVSPGTVRTRVVVYGPAGGLFAGATAGGAAAPAATGTDRARPVAIVTVSLAPGQATTVGVQFLNMRQRAPGLAVTVSPTLPGDGSTPVVGASVPVASLAVDCRSAIK